MTGSKVRRRGCGTAPRQNAKVPILRGRPEGAAFRSIARAKTRADARRWRTCAGATSLCRRPSLAASTGQEATMTSDIASDNPRSTSTTSTSTTSTWTTERVAMLKNLLQRRALLRPDRFEIGVSRNAVIGKMNRLGLSRGRRTASPGGHARPRRPASPARPHPAPRAQGAVRRGAGRHRCGEHGALLAVQPHGAQVPLADRRRRHARFQFLRQQHRRWVVILRGPCPHGLPVLAARARRAGPPREPRGPREPANQGRTALA